MLRTLLKLIPLGLMVAAPTAQAQYVVDFPVYPDDTFNYDYPKLDDAGENAIGFRSTPDIPSVNTLYVELGVNTQHMDCYTGKLNFYFDDVFLGQGTVGPLNSYWTLSGTFNLTASQVVDTTDHTLEVRLANDLPFCGDWIELDVENSYWELDLLNADADGDGSYSPTWHGDDCNDGDPTINPGAQEICDFKDNDCDGSIDEGVENTYFQDVDNDTYGNNSVTQQACSAPSGYVSRGNDCDDGDDGIYPAAPELCDGDDNDCDGESDEGATVTYFIDADGDTYGDGETAFDSCSEPTGYTDRGGDCNDNNDAVYPNAPEACDGLDNNCNGSIDEGVSALYYEDGDGDGFGTSTSLRACEEPDGYAPASGDCNDTNASIYPNAPELCDGLDNNCNGSTDEGVRSTYYPDGDADGFGTTSGATQACTLPDGFADAAGDCNDADAAIFPNAPEVCDAKDNNCNGSTDEGVLTTFYQDADGDTFGTSVTTQACTRPSGYGANPGDCDDSNDTVYPNAPELCDTLDNNCNGSVDEGVKNTYYEDADGDGVGVFANTTQACTLPGGYANTFGDCDDNDTTVYPEASELCDDQDNDCDTRVDEGVLAVVYRDVDGDGYGDSSDTLDECAPPNGYVGRGGDCNDNDAEVFPTNDEACDLKDNDCDAGIDEGVKSTFYDDDDGDGWGDGDDTTLACTAPNGFVARAGDCDDDEVGINPDAEEICNGLDDNCDTATDEGVTTTFFLDTDGDGFGVASSTTEACTLPDGYANQPGDCAADNGTTYPGADETCDLADDDCDGSVDEGVEDVFYQDVDGDGYGVPDVTTLACTTPDGYTDAAGDCDDSDGAVNPDGDEACNEIDDDCDAAIDEAVQTTFYVDSDGDGYGGGDDTVLACARPNGTSTTDDDCDDANGDVNPGASESCNGVDDNCDGAVDNGVLNTYYADTDDDGYGDAASPTQACELPDGHVSGNTDCDDSDGAVFPGAEELCNGTDDNCNGETDEGVTDIYFRDADGDTFGDAGVSTRACETPDGFVTNDEDCNDSIAGVNPDADESCNNRDDDCDTSVDEEVQTVFFADEDGDTFGTAETTTLACTRPGGFSPTADDCDDDDAEINPNANEICDEVDQDCDESIDEGVTDTFYGDGDDDGYGDIDDPTEACEVGDGYVDNSLDCDPNDGAISPEGVEICGDDIDQDCNGQDLSCDVTDSDNDGYAPVDGDCDDSNDTVYPGAEEVCDTFDNDCNGQVDDRDEDEDGEIDAACAETRPDATDCDDDNEDINTSAEEICGDGSDVDNDCSGEADDRDIDGDGAIDPACGGDDCDDEDPRLNPDAEEQCDGLDNDCSGSVDDLDADGDGYVSALCGTGGDSPDCDDDDPDVNPGAAEIEDGIDNNCDGNIDEGGDTFDDDGDGFTETGGDCDDTDAAVNPDADELPNDGIDNNCNGDIDENTDAIDDDGDGFTELMGDCNDDDASIYPGQTEDPEDGIDNDCDGDIDEGSSSFDDDGDGYSEDDGDCDDTNDDINPDAVEDPEDGIDNNCDGQIDETTDTTDDDGDGFSEEEGDCDDTDADVNPDATETQGDGIDNNCNGQVDEGADDSDDDGDGYTEDEGDCDDTDASVHPGAIEDTEDGIDNNCDGQIDEAPDTIDDDGDGYSEADGDCDDTNADIHPGAIEDTEDGIDNNCDGQIDEDPDTSDDDGDGYSEADGDCDDGDADISPGATELPDDGIDNDCDGDTDEDESTPTEPATPTESDGIPTESPTPADVDPSPTQGTGGDEGCECSSTPATGAIAGQLLMLLGGLTLLRRRD